jgi:LPS sulfotransferase NodH
MIELQHKRKQRRKETAEDFTPESLVNEMFDKLPQEVWIDPSKTFLDNSAGNGNFLVAILKRKLSLNHDPLIALSTIFGVELMSDNVDEMKERLLNELPSNTDFKKAKQIIDHNIVCCDALKFDYDKWKPINTPKAIPLF